MHQRIGRTEQRALASAAEMRQTPESTFHVRWQDTPELDAALARLIAQSAAIA